MTQYETYLRSLLPEVYIKLGTSTVDTASIYYSEFGSGRVTVGGTRTSLGSKPTLYAEDDGSHSIGLVYDNYMAMSSIGNTTNRSFTINIALRQDNPFVPNEIYGILGGSFSNMYVYGGNLCWENDNSMDNTPLVTGPAFPIGEPLLLTMTATSGDGHGGNSRVRFYFNGRKVYDSLEAGITIAAAHYSMYSKLFSDRSYNYKFGTQSSLSSVGAFAQEFTLFESRALTDFEVSKLGYLFEFAASPVTVSGTIIEGYAATDYRVRMHNSNDGALINEQVTSTGAFSALVPDLEYYVIVSAEQGEVWFPGLNAELGTKVYPTQPSLTRFYFECTTAGITGTTEPAWNTSEYGTTVDGTAVWTVVETLIQPICHAPVRGI